MIEEFSDRVLDLAARRSREARYSVTSGHARTCILCGDVEFDGYSADYEGGCWAFSEECGSCGLDMPVYVFYFRVEAEATYEARFIESIGCRHDCDGILNPELSPRTFDEEVTYHVEYPRIINNRISNHHVSYEPEITVPVCDRCHGHIHRDDGQYQALEPGMKRKEWDQ